MFASRSVPLAASWTDLLAYRQTLLAKSRTTLNWQLPGDETATEAEPATTNGRAPRRGRRAVAETAHG